MPRLLWVVLCLLFLTGCAGQSDAPTAIETYLKTMVGKDRDAFVKTFCADYEADALTEFDSFGAVEATLDGVDCESSGTDGGATLVTCSGSINVTYQGEDNQVLALDNTVYRAVQEGGEWKMCGYQ